MSEPSGHVYKFGPFRLDIARRLLFRDANDEVVRITPKQFDILRLLVENPEQRFSAQDLLDKFWPDKPVEENNLTQNITALRKALGEKPGENKYIQTIGNSYRFVADVDGSLPSSGENDAAGSDAGLLTFWGWLRGRGIVVTMLFGVCVILTLAVSVKGISSKWELTNMFVSGAQTVVLLLALLYPLRGPKGFRPIKELQNGGRLNEEIRETTGYDELDDWEDASEIATKGLERYTIYWRGILFTWFLLYIVLIFIGHPDLDLNCLNDSSRFCVGSLKDPTALALNLQKEDPLAQNLRKQFSAETQEQLEKYNGSNAPSRGLQRALVDGLNQRLKDCYLYDEKLFPPEKLSAETRRSIEQNPQPQNEEMIRRNQLLLRSAYPESYQDSPNLRSWGFALIILTTLFNNCSSLMIILCFNMLNKPIELRKRKRSISDTSVSIGAAFVVSFTLVEILLVTLPILIEKHRILLWSGWVSGIIGGIAMALYVGRLQSKFLGPPPLLVIALYSYTAIQSLFVFLEEGQVAAVILMDLALFLKYVLFLYMAWLFQSGRLLFYLVRVRRTYGEVKSEWRGFRNVLEEES